MRLLPAPLPFIGMYHYAQHLSHSLLGYDEQVKLKVKVKGGVKLMPGSASCFPLLMLKYHEPFSPFLEITRRLQVKPTFVLLALTRTSKLCI